MKLKLQTGILSLEHVVAALGATLTVPLIINQSGLPMSYQATLFFAGIGTLIFALCVKGAIPIILSSSFAFLSGYAIIPTIYPNLSGVEQLQYASGGGIIAGLLYLVLALICKLVGTNIIAKLFPPRVVGPIVMVIGLSLVPSAISNMSSCWWLAVLALVIFVIIQGYFKGFLKICALLISVIITTIIAGICGMVSVKTAAPLGMFQILNPKFSLSSILVMAPIAIASMSEHIGDINSVGAATGENYIETVGLHRTLLGDGLSTMISSFFGVCPTTTYSENISLLTLTKQYNPKITQIAGIIMIVLGFSPWFSSLVQAIPIAIIGGVSLLLYTTIASVGVKTVIDNKVDMSNTKNLIILSLILGIGLGAPNITIGNITITSMTSAIVIGLVLNLILPEE